MRSFELIKEARAATPTLLNPYFLKEFILYAYGSIENISAMLVQENEHSLEQPLAFFSQGLKYYEEKYSFVEKHVLFVVRNLKKFKYMLDNNRIKLMISHPSFKEFFLNKDLNDKRVGWVTKVMEFDVDIKVTKIVRGKGLCEKIADHTNNNEEDEEKVVLALQDEEKVVVPVPPISWVQEMTHFLLTAKCPHGLSKSRSRYYRLQSIPYVILNNFLFRKAFHGVLLRFIDVDQVDKVLHEFHEGST